MSTLILPNNRGVRIAFKTAAHLARTKYDQVANCKDCSLDTKDLYNSVATFFDSQHLTLEEEHKKELEGNPSSDPVVQHNADRYVAIELAGVMAEYLAMPCKSLEDRMRNTMLRYDSRIKAMVKAHQGIPEGNEPR